MIRYTLVDHKTYRASKYSAFMWNLTWFLVWVFGLATGILIGCKFYYDFIKLFI